MYQLFRYGFIISAASKTHDDRFRPNSEIKEKIAEKLKVVEENPLEKYYIDALKK